MTPSFVHLRVHSEFSLVDGLVRVGPLMKSVSAAEMPAVAVTDRTNFFGLIKAYKAAEREGVKLIVGADFQLLEDDERRSQVTFLAQNHTGYRNLTILISRAYQEGQVLGKPLLRREWIEPQRDGLLVLSGGRKGDVGQHLLAGRDQEAKTALTWWMDHFPDRFYLELQRTGREYEEDYLHAAVALAEQHECPVVATNEVCFLRPGEFDAHEARVCIGDGRTLNDPRRARHYSEQQYLKSPEEMLALFADIPEAIENTVHVASRCTLEIELGKAYLPDFPTPAGVSIEQHLEDLSNEGLDRRLEQLSVTQESTYRDRLKFELGIINQMGFPGYFLVVMDFIRWGKVNGIPVGPGRGSGAGSLVAYALEITDVDPIEYDLLFERFLNPQRVSMPDFDVDFCMDRRDEVIDYVANTYGRDAVSQIITFGTMAAKAVVRDVARVQDKPYALADKMSKLIPFEVGMTLEKALEQEEQLVNLLQEDSAAQEIWDMAVQLEGLTRNAGKHAGGVVIAPSKLTDFSPLFCDEEGQGLVTQYDKNDVEDAGLVKFDFLGLRTLTIIDWAVAMINQRNDLEAPVDIKQIPLDDGDVYRLLQSARTTAVFQLESRGMKELIKNLRPDCFEDIIALVALFRPGPLQSGMVENFIDRKHGRERVSYPDVQYQHEWLKPILEPTYGIILYQEQVMQIAQELAGYTLGGADLLRRAMGKKKPEEMAKQRSVFEDGAKDKGVDPTLAMKIFDLVEKFAGYGFNKSHSAAYALVSYQTAWLKCHYPAEFMSAVMSSEIDNTDKLLSLRDECNRMGLTVRAPNVGEGRLHFSVNKEGHIVYGLGGIKGLGEGPIDDLIAARTERSFEDLFDLCSRTDPRKVNRRALEALIKSGALDELGADRAVLMSALDDGLRAAEQSAANEAAGMGDLFGEVVPSSEGGDPYRDHRRARSWTLRDVLAGEKESLGSFLSGHPMDEFEQEVRKFSPRCIRELTTGSKQWVAGLIVDVRLVKTQRGTMAVLQLDDGTGQIEATAYSEVYETHRELLIKDQIVLADGRLQVDDFRGQLSLRAKSFTTLEMARTSRVRELKLELHADAIQGGVSAELKRAFSGSNGECPVVVQYRQPAGSAIVRLGDCWRVTPTDTLLDQLKEIIGHEAVEVVYER
jgi:DNA polymerase-3 subunit alpha